MKKIVLTLITLVFIGKSHSQTAKIITEEWIGQPTLHKIDTQYRSESAVILLDKRRMEFIDEGTNVVLYRTIHRIVHINDDRGIESYNKIYLGITNNSDITDIRARTILPGGRVIEIDKKNIKDLKEEDGNLYKIFAMDGLEKGCEVEYFYTYRRETSFFGRELIQGVFPVLEAQMEVVAPPRLIFQFKGYNCQLPISDTTLNGKRIFSTSLRDIAGAEKEKYAAYTANLKRVEYKLSYNTSTSNGHERLFTWNDLAKRIHAMYSVYSNKELEKAGDLIQTNGWDKLGSDREKIIAIESLLKTKFTTREDIDATNAGNLEWIIKNRIASHAGMIRLFGALFERSGVEYQIVLTCDREEQSIDRSFENWNNTSDFVFYFPTTKKFLAPTLSAIRYPWINPYWGAEEVLFCKTTTIGNFTTAMGEVRQLPLEDYSMSFDKIKTSLRLNNNMDTVLVDLERSFAGYMAEPYRAGYTLSTPEEQRVMVKELVKAGTNSENIVSSEVLNAGFEDYADNKPFTLKATVKSGELLENAGNKILIKIGDVIGPQVEMYQEKKRQFPIQIEFPHTLERTIEFRVPNGYVVKNPEDLVIHQDYDEGGVVTMGFSSDYTVDGDLIKVHVMEQYRKTDYPVSDYDKFRKVINASADFNKIVLIIQKKG